MKVLNKPSPPGALKALKDPLAYRAVARIEHRTDVYTGEPYVQILSVKQQKQGVFIPTIDELPTYDMSKIDVSHPKFYCEDFNERIYKACCRSEEGRIIVNNFKNEKTLELIDQHTKDCLSDIKVRVDKFKEGHVPILKKFLNLLLRTPLAEEGVKLENSLPFRHIRLKREEVWIKFKEAGLVQKITSLKNINHESRS